MPTLLYTPAIRIAVSTRTYGIIDISDDLLNGSLTINSNAPHSLSFNLMNQAGKYSQVFTPNDRLIVQMKRIAWLQVFSGYLDEVPYFSVYPGNVSLTATCTAKRILMHWWSPSYVDSIAAVARWLGKGNSNLGEVGLPNVIRHLLTDVVGWDNDKIHIGAIPPKWYNNPILKELWGDVQLTQRNALSFIGSQSSTPGAKLITTNIQSVINGVAGPPGTDLPTQSGQASYYVGTVASGGLPAAGSIELPTHNLESDPWYAAMHWTWYNLPGSRLDPSTPQGKAVAWLRGSDSVEKVKNPIGLPIVVKNVDTRPGAGYGNIIVVHAADYMADSDPNRAIDLSPHAWEALTGNANPGLGVVDVEVAWATDPNQKAGIVTPSVFAAANHLTTGTGGKSVGANPVWPFPTMDITNQSRRLDQGWDLQYAGTKPVPVYAVESGVVTLAGPDPNGFGNSYPVLTLDFPAAGNYRQVYYGHVFPLTNINGQHVAKGQQIATTGGVHSGGNAFPDSNWLEIGFWNNGPVGPQSASTMQNWLSGGSTSGQVSSTKSNNLFSASGSNGQSTTSGMQTDNKGNLLKGTIWDPLAANANINDLMFRGLNIMIQDTELLPYFNDVVAAAQRNWCSAPNGDIIVWFPDYFGAFGATKWHLSELEMLPFELTWSDTHMVTHQFVAGTMVQLNESIDPLAGAPQPTPTDWAISSGIATIDIPGILELLTSTKSTDGGLFSSADAIYEQFGARPDSESAPLVTHGEVEFWFALSLWMQAWANMFQANVECTFMPELWPGMLLALDAFGLQCYINSVTHTFELQGNNPSFATSVNVCAPSALDGSGLIGMARSGSPVTGAGGGGSGP